MEGGGQIREIAVDEAGIIVPGGQAHNVAVACDLLDEGQLCGVCQQGKVHGIRGRNDVAVSGQIFK